MKIYSPSITTSPTLYGNDQNNLYVKHACATVSLQRYILFQNS